MWNPPSSANSPHIGPACGAFVLFVVPVNKQLGKQSSCGWFETSKRYCRHRNYVITERIFHYIDVIMGAITSQITSLTIVYSTVHSGAYQRKHQSSAALAFVRGIHRGPVNSPHKWPVSRKMFPFDDVIMCGWLVGDYGLQLASSDIQETVSLSGKTSYGCPIVWVSRGSSCQVWN